MPYTMGQPVRLKATFTDPDTGVLYDPSTVEFLTLGPSTGQVTTYGAVQMSTGVWYVDFLVEEPGQWWARVVTTGPEDACERTFFVNSSLFTGA